MVNEQEIFGDDWKGLQEGVGATPPQSGMVPKLQPMTAPTLPMPPRRQGSRFWSCLTAMLAVIGALTVLLIIADVAIFTWAASSGKGFLPGMGSGKVEREVIRTGKVDSVVAIVSLEGIINGETWGGDGETDGFVEVVESLKTEPNLKAVVIEINSPGGSATMSDMINHHLREVSVPKVAMLEDIAASGGYYVAVACDKIVASPTSITGSIGVILEVPQVSGLMDKIGVGMLTVKSAPHKDLASPFKPTDPEEVAILQKAIDVIYERFVSVVAQGRKMKVEDVKVLADGRVLAAPDALAAGLIDGIGYREDAVAEAEKMAGVEGSTVVRMRPSRGIFRLLGLEQHRADPMAEVAKLLQIRGPLYLYRGPER